jgi:hypothetical protein
MRSRVIADGDRWGELAALARRLDEHEQRVADRCGDAPARPAAASVPPAGRGAPVRRGRSGRPGPGTEAGAQAAAGTRSDW